MSNEPMHSALTQRGAFVSVPSPAFACSARTVAGAVAVMVAVVSCPAVSLAASITWSATASTNSWTTGSNWVGGVVPANSLTTDVAVFNQTSYLTQPSFNARSINGIVIGDGTTVTAQLALGTGVEANRGRIGSGGVTMYANAGTVTFGTTGAQGILLGANQTWANNSSNPLTVRWLGNANGTDTSTPYTVTIAGTGAGGVLISTGVSSGTSTSGSAGSAVGFVVDGGRLTLNTANTIDGGVNLKAGLLLLATNGALGSGTLTINGGKLAVTVLSGTAGVGRTTGASVIFNNDFTAGDIPGTALAGSQLTIEGAMTLTGNRTITVDSGAGFNLYGGISDGGNGFGIVKSGGSLLRLGGVNTYTGDTRSEEGTIAIAGNLAVQNSMLDTSGAGSFSFVTLNSTLTPTIGGFKGGKNAGVNSGVQSITLNLRPGVTGTYSGVIGASGTFAIIKVNEGTQIFSAAQSYTGTTDIRAGTLQIGNAGTTGALSLSSAITGSSGGTLAFNRTNTITQGTDFNSVISGGISVAQAGTGTLILNGLNTYSGGTRITAGTLRAGGTSAFGSGGIILSSGATLDLNSLAVANTITNNGGTIINAASFTGTTQLTTGSTTLSNIGGTLDIDASAVADLSGTIDATVIVKNGGRGRAAGQIRKNVTVNAGAHFDILDGATVDDGGSISFANNGQIHIDRTNALIVSKVISGTGSLRKSGSSRVQLTGQNTFTGVTQVDAGALIVNGALAGDVVVASGATLGGSGVLGDTLSGGGLISVGNSPGIGTAGSVDPSLGTDWVFEITGIAPIWNSGTSASVNDVLRLTDVTPFVSNLTSSNVVDILFNLGATPIEQGDYLGGFFVDNLSVGELTAKLTGGQFRYWVVGAHGTSGDQQSFNVGSGGTPVTYSLLSAYDSSLTASYKVTQQTVSFGSTNVSGAVTQFVIVPEPAALVVAGVGIMTLCAASSLRRCRRG